MGKQKLAAVVFDCDGVLIESNTAKTQAFGGTVEEFGQDAMDKLMAYHREHGGVSRFKKFEWFYREVLETPLSEERMDTLCQRFASLCMDAVLDAPMVDGAMQSLDLLKEKAVPIFVASGTPEKELRDVLDRRGLSPYFKDICGTPPEKEHLLEGIISANRFDASSVVMVGDAVTDLNAAAYNHTLFYGRGSRFADDNVPWGEDLKGLAAYLCNTFDLK